MNEQEQDLCKTAIRLANKNGRLETLIMFAETAIAEAMKCDISPAVKSLCDHVLAEMGNYWEQP